MCSACLILISNKKVLMVKARYKDHWTFPSGIVDYKESPKSAALRENREKTGLSVNSCEHFATIYTSAKTPEDRDRFNFAFIASVDSTDIEMTIPNDEIAEAKWINYNQIAGLSGNKKSYIEFQKFHSQEKLDHNTVKSKRSNLLRCYFM